MKGANAAAVSGPTELKVTDPCLAAMTFGREADEATSWQLMDPFAEAGGALINAADVPSKIPGRPLG